MRLSSGIALRLGVELGHDGTLLEEEHRSDTQSVSVNVAGECSPRGTKDAKCRWLKLEVYWRSKRRFETILALFEAIFSNKIHLCLHKVFTTP